MELGTGGQLSVILLAGVGPGCDWIREQVCELEELQTAVETLPERLVHAVGRQRPDIVLLCSMSALQPGCAIFDRIRGTSAKSRLVFAGSADQVSALRIQRGLAALLDIAQLDRNRLRQALLSVAAGLYISTTAWGPPECLVCLTEHEQEVLQGLSYGLTEEEMEKRYHISRSTVVRAIAGLEQKLETKGRFMLGAKAAQLGLIEAG